jgi:hypothetical protein
MESGPLHSRPTRQECITRRASATSPRECLPEGRRAGRSATGRATVAGSCLIRLSQSGRCPTSVLGMC